MTDDLTSAFSHPDSRAIAMAMPGVADRLSLRDHIVEVEIGAFQAERDMTQRVAFDIVVEVAAPDADLDDDVDRILSYDRITWAIEHELAAERLNLLETLAERIADRILNEPQAIRVFVRIQKLDKGNGKLGVEIVRVPGQGAAQDQDLRQPIVAFLSNEALASDLLPSWMRQLREAAGPLVLALDVPETRLKAASAASQRQIDLLAIEQAAWQLAAVRTELTVAATRTELDWAMKNGLPCVWAPSKLVLDATDEPPLAPEALAQWFAGHWGAQKLVVIGKTLPEPHTIPTQFVTLSQSKL